MYWSTKLSNWYQGKDIVSYKSSKAFLYETSPIIKESITHDGIVNITGIYHEKFIDSDELDNLSQDSTDFDEYLANPNNEYCTSFYNLSKTTRLIIPTKLNGSNYKSLKEFIENAPHIQQQYFWKQVSIEAYNMLKQHSKIWISTHGLGVPYLHVRVEVSPKYYKTSEFCN